MILDATQVDALQNSLPPTDWTKFDQQLTDRSNFDQNRFALDSKLHVRFFMKPTIDAAESAKQNRPVYKDTPYVECMIPGDKHNIVVEPVWEQWIQRFPRHWDQFQMGQKEQIIGTPLKVAPFLTESQVMELGYFNIRTIEQLAGLSDGNMTFMGARMFRDAAAKFLEKQTSNETLLERIASLEAKLAAAETSKEPETPVVEEVSTKRK